MRRILITRHGILLNRLALFPAARYFRGLGYEVHNRTYRSTKKRIEDHARDLAEELRGIEASLERSGEPYELYALTHSMGGLILRYAATHFAIPRLRRVVMLAPPNRGSLTARYFKNFLPYRMLFGGMAGRQLAEDPPGIFGEAGVPEGLDIGILAGNVRWKLYPVPLEKPHDAIVSVSEASLPPFPLKVLPYGHTPILFARRAWEEAAHFLEHGKFREA
jgi:pimeloyl-ACP methyl ester carboxylesterase